MKLYMIEHYRFLIYQLLQDNHFEKVPFISHFIKTLTKLFYTAIVSSRIYFQILWLNGKQKRSYEKLLNWKPTQKNSPSNAGRFSSIWKHWNFDDLINDWKNVRFDRKKAGTAWGNPIYVAIFPSKVIDSDLFWPKVIIPVAHSYYTNTL